MVALAQTGVCDDAWRLLERHLHKFTFSQSGPQSICCNSMCSLSSAYAYFLKLVRKMEQKKVSLNFTNHYLSAQTCTTNLAKISLKSPFLLAVLNPDSL